MFAQNTAAATAVFTVAPLPPPSSSAASWGVLLVLVAMPLLTGPVFQSVVRWSRS